MLRQPVDDQFVADLEEPEDQLVGQRVVEGDGDPVTLVQVVARPDGRVLGAERFSQGRLALEAHGQWPRVEGRHEGDIAVELDRTSTEAGVYPLVLISYAIACTDYADDAEAELVKGYLSYIASAEGQEAGQANAGNAPISDSLRERVNAAIDLIVAE